MLCRTCSLLSINCTPPLTQIPDKLEEELKQRKGKLIVKYARVQITGEASNLPKYQTRGSSGLDLIAHLKEKLTILPNKWEAVPTGIKIALPYGLEAQIRPQSGLALKKGITVLNAPGTIDSDYRGEIKVILKNTSNSAVEIENGDRIAQMVVVKYKSIEWEQVDGLPITEQNEKGFGSTDNNSTHKTSLQTIHETSEYPQTTVKTVAYSEKVKTQNCGT